MYRLTNTTQHYAWGSPSAISELLGREPSGQPEAELWMGAHPTAPSRIDGGEATLLDFVSADPVGMLGPQVAARFKNRLPFLLKVLSAAKALSIQTHPTRAQAEAGYAAEQERGLPAGDPDRNYADDWPKPEILMALTAFEALAGCRSAEDAERVLAAVVALGAQALEPVRAELADKPEPATVAAAIGRLLEWPADTRGELVASVVEACRAGADKGGESAELSAGELAEDLAEDFAAVLRVAEDFPGDIGLVAMLLMKRVVLEPGEAIFLEAGGLHAYLRGTGVELLANSDNVLRAGLTPKHIDVAELLRVMDASVPVPVRHGTAIGVGVVEFDTPAPEFRLYHATLDTKTTLRAELPGTGPRIVLALSGEVELRGTRGALTLTQGESCFVPAREGRVEVSGLADLVVAAPGV
ncbi:mannose-6-phosphate isomerase, class I [Catenulispora pinisilvae]|uniref:mannose-6-phosphate isomerase, class I n=1 Tax=Catenulispora pinisilvae TaxID=2705253 RepID=UPI00189236D7|nr:mannose-6-phosphate isomerase, class I [Catenulispora pinisilvae]